MTETVSFPGLGLEFTLNRTAFTIGGWPVRWYGILFAGAALLAMLYIFRRVKEFGVDADRMVDVLLGSILGGMVCARAYYVAFSWDTYKDNPAAVFHIWEGGIAMYGGLIGAVLLAVIFCRWRKVKLLPAMDVGLTGLMLAQAIGRWGNFVNIEAFGSETTLPWGMTSHTIASVLGKAGALAHPTFLYESLWCLLGFAFLALYTKRRRFDGELTLLYLGWYGLGRFFIEGLRMDSLMIGSLRVSQMLALACAAFSAAMLLTVRARIRRKNDSDYLKLYGNTAEGQAVVNGTFYKKQQEETPAQEETDEAQKQPAQEEQTAQTEEEQNG